MPDLLAKAQSLMAEMDAELARRFAARILEMEPNNFEAREMLGIIEAEEGNIDAARKVSLQLVLFIIIIHCSRLKSTTAIRIASSSITDSKISPLPLRVPISCPTDGL